MSRKGLVTKVVDLCRHSPSAAAHSSTYATAFGQTCIPRELAKVPSKRLCLQNVWRNAAAYSLTKWPYKPHTSRSAGTTCSFASAAVPQESKAKSCWFCGDCSRSEQQFSCDNCGYLQPPDKNVDYFTLFGMKRTFEVDQKLLERRFREMQMAVHPDKHATKGDDVKMMSQQQSSHLNTGFSILKCPLARAKYLVQLDLEGLQISEEARIDDAAFLMEVMELREEASAAQDRDELLRLAEQNFIRRTHYAERIRDAYAQSDFQGMIKLVQELTYFHRIEELLRDKL